MFTKIPEKYSFKLVSQSELRAVSGSKKQQVVNTVSVAATQAEQITETDVDTSKRTFLKIAGMAGLGLVASQLLPSKAEALIIGNHAQSTTAVGIKDSSNLRIDPAKEATALDIKTATEGTQTNTASIKTNTDTLVTNSNKFTFVGDSLKTVTSLSSDVLGLKDDHDVRINPAIDDSIVLLRRMVKLMESQATVDTANRQRITLDAWGTSVQLGVGTSASCPRVGLGTDSTVGTVTSVTNVATIGSYAAQQMYGDVAHDVYANALRRNLTFV